MVGMADYGESLSSLSVNDLHIRCESYILLHHSENGSTFTRI